jgi:anaerobic ribonucleoside-triphosphate reductase activating protein
LKNLRHAVAVPWTANAAAEQLEMNKRLPIGGIVSVTTVDYPGHIATVVFLQGCCWRCSYCHNQHLQPLDADSPLEWNDVRELLKSRVGFIEAVVFSGGEPLIQPKLSQAIREVKDMGLLVGLHTAGTHPWRLVEVSDNLDWIGIDVKHRFDKYDAITRVEGSGEAAKESLRILVDLKKDFEARVTVCGTLEVADVVAILQGIASMGVKTVVLQKCRDKNEETIEHPVFFDKVLLDDMSERFDSFCIR